VNCYFGVFRAIVNKKNKTFEHCKSLTTDVSNYSFTYHPIPAATPCEKEATEPCGSDWISKEYGEVHAWRSQAEMAECSPCKEPTPVPTPVPAAQEEKGIQFGGYLKLPTMNNVRSISLWARLTNFAHDHWVYLLDARSGLGSGWFTAKGLGGDWSKLYVNGAAANNWKYHKSNFLPDNQWMHIYVEAGKNFNDDINFMSRVSNNEHATGYLHGIAIWSTTKTEAQIKQMAQHVAPPNTDGLLAYFPFSEGSGSTVTSDLGYTNLAISGTLHGSPTWHKSSEACSSSQNKKMADFSSMSVMKASGWSMSAFNDGLQYGTSFRGWCGGQCTASMEATLKGKGQLKMTVKNEHGTANGNNYVRVFKNNAEVAKLMANMEQQFVMSFDDQDKIKIDEKYGIIRLKDVTICEVSPNPAPQPAPPVLSWVRDLPGTTSYDQAVQYCEAKDARLCTRAEICPNGHSGEEMPDGGFSATSDSWVPTSDSENSWVQTGKTGWPPCLLHTEINGGKHGKPSWGTQNGNHGFRHDVCCSS